MLKGKLRLGDILGGLFQAKTPPLIGVDISSSSVKMVELGEGGRGRIRLERYAIEPLPKDAVVDGNIMNLEAVGDSLRRGWKRMGSRIKNLAMALPSAQVITKKITVPAGLREDELETQVETEANQYSPARAAARTLAGARLPRPGRRRGADRLAGGPTAPALRRLQPGRSG